MLISHKYKFIYIRCRKVGSTSSEIALSEFLEANDVITPISARDELIRANKGFRGPQNYQDLYYNHMSSQEIKEVADPRIWDNYYKFCFERNPWDKVISLYFHRNKTKHRPPIIDFITSGEAADAINCKLYTIEGRIVVDHIGKYENFFEEWLEIVKILGLPKSLDLPQAKSQFRKNKIHYSQYLSSYEASLITSMYEEELKYSQYTF
ncbi:sulfotransferase family 2 domain-containing protein [Paenibacillus sp. NPDC058177]|uniref:sulfotransferase family 2 domain-containing protein n=1 Tax=Paenibacillus sp. NPDC058177 TaxID=3346369 RepID=UPI0036DAB985